MAQIVPPVITPSGAVPIRGTATFKVRVDAFLTWMAAAVAQFAAATTNCYNNAVDAYNSAVAAAASATTATTQAAAAIAGANVAAWVSGTAYVVGNVRYSPANFRSYRRITAGSGATDPSADSTNWLLVSNGPFAIFHMREEQASGTASTPATFIATGVWRIPLNTVKTHTFPPGGAALSGNQFLLPAGGYHLAATASRFASQGSSIANLFSRLALFNVTDGVYVSIGHNVLSKAITSGDYYGPPIGLVCDFEIAAAKLFELRHLCGASSSVYGASSTGQVETYGDNHITKVS